MNDASQNNSRGRNWRRIWFWLGCFALLLVFVWLVVEWSGKSAWEHYQRQWEARGERFDFASFVPKPVPAGQNFALAPIVASSYAFCLDTNGNKISPQHTNAVDRLKLEIYGDNSLVEMPTNGLGSWTRGLTSDLRVWQNYYRALAAKTNLFPVPPQPQSPAADVLLALSKYDPAIEELRAASRLPDSRFPLNYNTERPFDILLPHLAALKRCSQALQLRAIAELQNGQPAQALDDVKLMLRLTESIRTEPFLISHLVRIAMVQIALQPIWEGLTEHKWSDAQLAELDRELARLDFLADYEFSLRGERAMSIATIERLRRKRDFRDLTGYGNPDNDQPAPAAGQVAFHFIPGSFFYQNELTIARMHQQMILPLVDVERRIISPEAVRRSATNLDAQLSHFSFHSIFARMLIPALGSAVKKYAYAQSAADLARVAGALERYRLAHGEFPESLDALSPALLEKIPHDVINGQPLHYRRTAPDKFLLYSVGWNETDDGGAVVMGKTGRVVDTTQGDWVWPGAVSGSQ